MKLRIAKKIMKAVGTPDQDRYNEGQLQRAYYRTDKTADNRRANQFWNALMTQLGPRGRAEVLADGAPAMAFDLLMRTPEEEWTYGPQMLTNTESTE